MGLDTITTCRMCNSSELILHSKYSYETVHFNDVEEKEIIGEVKLCSCGTLHFEEGGRMCCQKNHIETKYNYVAVVADNEKHLQN